MEAIASKPLDPSWKGLLSLSTRRPPEFYEKSDDVGNVPHAATLRTTFDRLGASAVFCVQHVPTVVILSVDEYDPARVAPLHAALWNQGLASLLVVISGDTVRVFTLARIPHAGDDEDFHERCLIRTLDLVNHALALRNLVYATESGRFWESNRDYFDPRERVDQVLLGNLTASHRLLCRAGLSPDAAQALLVQAMFVAYLEDREIIGAEYFRDASNTRAGDFETLLHAGGVESLERLFDTLRKDFNGDLFVASCSFDANDPGPHLDASHLEILARFRSGREEMHGPSGQYRLPVLHGKALRHGDFFAIEPDRVPVDVVVGNPPWSSRRGERHGSIDWCQGEGLPAPGREQAWPFVWKSLRHLRKNGVVAFLLPAMGFLHNHAGQAVEARQRLMREARVFSVVNFADMRFQLFDGAVRPAALLLFGRPPAGGAAYRFDYLTPKADLNLRSRRLITISSADRRRLDSRMVETDPSVFKKRLWMSEPAGQP